MRGITLRLYHDPPLAEIQAIISQAQAAGADTIALVPHHYIACEAGSAQIVKQPFGWIWADTAQAPGLVGNTTPLATVQACAEAVRAVGLALVVKPHLDIAWHQADGSWGYGGWRGYAEPPDVSTWRDAYRAFLRSYVGLAQQTGATLCMGCELYTVTKQHGAGWWVDLARWVRQNLHFTGPLTYAANWGWGDDAEVRRLEPLWAAPQRSGRPLVQWIGLDAYYPLADVPTTDPAILAAGWARVQSELAPLLARVGKPLLFTEAGWANWTLAPVEPWQVGAARDDAAQAACWESFLRAWPGVAFIAWESAVPGLPDPDVSHNLLRDPALAARVLGGAARIL